MGSESVSTAPAIQQPAQIRGAAALLAHPLWIAFAVTALLTALRLTGTVDSDVAWQLWIAGRIHAGAHLYRDIIEVNPPLWFWMALPLDSAASLLHVPIEDVLAVATGAVVMLSLAATDRLLTHVPAARRTALLVYCALILLWLPWVHLGQREQIVLVGALPYPALIAARRDGRSVPPLLALSIGAGAAAGFALKHYFLIAPAALELWLITQRGRCWRRPELLAMLAVGALYAAAILMWASDFLTRIVPLVRLSYGMLGAGNMRQLLGPFAAVALVTLGAAIVGTRPLSRKAPALASALTVAAGAFALAYFVQSKGWIYHAIPMLGLGSLALAALLAESGAPRLLRIVAPALLLMPLILTAEELTIGPDTELEAAVAGLQPGDTVGFLTTESAIPWSVTLQHHFRYPSRYMAYWMMRAVVNNELAGNPQPRLEALGRQVVSDTVEDFTCAPPKRLIVTRPKPGESGFDILPFFLRDPSFARLLSHYRMRARTSFESYELVYPLPAPAFPCRAGV